jgi:D-alanine-D-alanine ligase-like ATP-grasp enzyme
VVLYYRKELSNLYRKTARRSRRIKKITSRKLSWVLKFLRQRLRKVQRLQQVEHYLSNDHLKYMLLGLKDITKTQNSYKKSYRASNRKEYMAAAAARGISYICLPRRLMIFYKQDKRIGFSLTSPHPQSYLSFCLEKNKILTKRVLIAANLPVARGNIFLCKDRAVEYCLELGFKKFVVKPLNGSQGRGVTIVDDIASFDKAWLFAKRICDEVVIEEYIQGVDLRVLVIGGRACIALLRIPPSICGDGINTIRSLINDKKKARKHNPRLKKTSFVIDDQFLSYLAINKLTLESVLAKGEHIFLSNIANISRGGDSLIVTNLVHPDLLKLAEDAAATLSLDCLSGVDIIVENIKEARDGQNCIICEINSRPSMHGVHYPMHGPPQNAAQYLIDALFTSSEATIEAKDREIEVLIRGNGLDSSAFCEFLTHSSSSKSVNLSVCSSDDESMAFRLIGSTSQLLALLWNIYNYETESVAVKGFNITNGNLGIFKPVPTVLNSDWLCDQVNEDSPLAQSAIYHENDLIKKAFRNNGYESAFIGDSIWEITDLNQKFICTTRFSSRFSNELCHNKNILYFTLGLHGLSVPQLSLSDRNEAKKYLTSNSCFTLMVWVFGNEVLDYVLSDIESEKSLSSVKIHNDFLRIAVQAIASIPGLEFGCVQILLRHPEFPQRENEWAIIGIDTLPKFVPLFKKSYRNGQLLLDKIINQYSIKRSKLIEEL